jgi:hypothetical protein
MNTLNKRYVAIKDKHMIRVGNTFYFNYHIIDTKTNEITEKIKSYFKLRPLTEEERLKDPSPHLTVGIIYEWENNAVYNLENKVKILNDEQTR